MTTVAFMYFYFIIFQDILENTNFSLVPELKISDTFARHADLVMKVQECANFNNFQTRKEKIKVIIFG